MKNTDYRSELMTKSEIALADHILSCYQASWQDKERRGLFDLWETVESYWEGDVRRSSAGAPNSNINFVHSGVEGQVALLSGQDVEIEVNPLTSADEPFAEQASIVLNWVKSKNKLRRKLDSHERRREKFGTGVLRVLFDPSGADGYGLPEIESVNPAYIFPDPAISDVYKIQQGAFLIETLTKPISWAKQQFGQALGSAIKAGFDPNGRYVWDENSGDVYLHILAWIRTDGHLRLVQVSGDGIILSDSGEEESVYPSGKFPYFLTPLYIREGTVWAKGDAELMLSLQDLVDELDDQIRINARLSGNPQRLVEVGSNIDIDKWTNEAGLIIPTSNINGVKHLIPPEMPEYIRERREWAMKYERPMLTRFGDQMTGQSPTHYTTATETQALISQGTDVIAHKKAVLAETLEEVFEYCLLLMKEYAQGERTFRVGEGEFTRINPRALKSIPTGDMGSKDAEFDIKVNLGLQ